MAIWVEIAIRMTMSDADIDGGIDGLRRRDYAIGLPCARFVDGDTDGDGDAIAAVKAGRCGGKGVL